MKFEKIVRKTEFITKTLYIVKWNIKIVQYNKKLENLSFSIDNNYIF